VGRSRTWLALALGIAAALIAAAPVSATVTCDVQNGGGLDIRVTTSNEVGSISRSGENIVVREGTLVTCLDFASQPVTPTISGTPVILISSEPGVSNDAFIVDDAPGFSSIPTFVNLRNGASSLLIVRVGDFLGKMVFGTSGVDTDAQADGDLDITANNVPKMEGGGGYAVPVDVTAQGGGTTGAALTNGIEFLGSSAADSLGGSEGDDVLWSFPDTDGLNGYGGNDRLKPGAGNDSVEGGPGADTVDYSDLSAGVAVDLALSGSQSTGGGGNDALSGIENVTGTTLVDILRGDGAPNRIEASGGIDLIDGRGGADAIFAGVGNDEIEARDGGHDVVECSIGTDKVTTDAPGVDTLTECEEIDFASAATEPTTGQPDTPTALPPTLPALPPIPPVAPQATIASLRLVPSTFAALSSGRGARNSGHRKLPRVTTISFRLDMTASVTFQVARRLRHPKRLTLLPGSFTRTAQTGLNRFRFAGRIAGHALPPGSYQLQATPQPGTGAIARAPFRLVGG